MTFVRISNDLGHFSVPEAVAARADESWKVLDDHEAVDRHGRPLPPKLRVDLDAATPTPEPEATDVSADTEETA